MNRLSLAFVLAVALCTACDDTKNTSSKVTSDPDLHGTGVQVVLTPIENGANKGKWKASYTLSEPQRLVFFPRSIGNYRLGDWQAENPDTRLQRVGGFDTVVLSEPRQQFAFIFTPYTQGLAGDYTPFIPFSDGGLAVFTGQFEVLAAQSLAELELLDGNLSEWQGHQPWTGVVIESSKRMIDGGEIKSGRVVTRFFGEGHYVYLGDNEIVNTPSFIGVLDPALPAWLRNRLGQDMADIFSYLEQQFQQALELKPTVLFAFRGSQQEGLSNTGGAIGNHLLALEASGTLLLEENDRVLRYFHWFLAHEAAHLFQGSAMAYLGAPDDRWITEGGANAIANFALRDLGLTDTEYLASLATRSFENCAAFLATGQSLAMALQDASQAHYSCGEMFAYITEASLKDTSYTEFWRYLLTLEPENNSVSGTQLYLEAMSKLGASQALVTGMQRLIAGESEQPYQQLLNLFTLSGVPYQLDAQRRLSGINF